MGNYGWSWKEVLPYFLKSERSRLENLRNSPYHSRNGELSVEYNQFRTKLIKAFVESAKYLGQKEVDYNSGHQLGVSYLQSNTLQGKRHSAYRAFIEPILHRSNLHIMINTRVTKILIDPITKVTYGIELVRKKKRFRIMARKEVILSAGAFSSPHLLIVSGIGTKSDLQRIKVPLIKELPVGKIMYDHLSHIGPTFIVNTTGESLNTERALNPDNLFEYIQGRGILTVPGGVEGIIEIIYILTISFRHFSFDKV
jgi:choline dehydrogenase-like flavoprotein